REDHPERQNVTESVEEPAQAIEPQQRSTDGQLDGGSIHGTYLGVYFEPILADTATRITSFAFVPPTGVLVPVKRRSSESHGDGGVPGGILPVEEFQLPPTG